MDITDRSFTLSLSSRQVKKRSYDEVTAKMQQIEEQHPDKAEFLSIGTTPEGRDIRVLRLSNDIKSDTSLKRVFGKASAASGQTLVGDRRNRALPV